jgi:hypothetical protein
VGTRPSRLESQRTDRRRLTSIILISEAPRAARGGEEGGHAHGGFELATLGDFIFQGLALAAPRDTLPVLWTTITEAGRQAIAE